MNIRPKPRPVDISVTDIRKCISYLSDAASLYDALPMQACKSRAHMINILVQKLKTRIPS